MAVIKRKTKDKRWKVCFKCIKAWPDHSKQYYKYDKAQRNYAKRCKRYIKRLEAKWRNKHEWDKPCNSTNCKYSMELMILDQ